MERVTVRVHETAHSYQIGKVLQCIFMALFAFDNDFAFFIIVYPEALYSFITVCLADL